MTRLIQHLIGLIVGIPNHNMIPSVIPMNMSMEQVDLLVVSHLQRHPGPHHRLYLAYFPFLAVFRREKVVWGTKSGLITPLGFEYPFG